MSILKLELKNIGPFDRLELDFSNGDGTPHLGPHIIAGTNGSGKSTILRTIAHVMDSGSSGSDVIYFSHLLRSRPEATMALAASGGPLVLPWDPGPRQKLLRGADVGKVRMHLETGTFRVEAIGSELLACAYAPTRSLRHLKGLDLSIKEFDSKANSLSFEATVDNQRVQAWLLGLYSRMAIAEQKHQASDAIRATVSRFESGLSAVYGQPVKLDVNVDGPTFEPRINVFGQSLNFSQLPDGVRVTIGWFADYMMRQDRQTWLPELGEKRPGVILLDEIESHLHPLWQRRLLPGMKKALPDVQIIATSHSPFLISSCRSARIHVLEMNSVGRASLRESVDAPIGDSVATILSDIFGVDSQFDIETEEELNDWAELNKQRLYGKLSTKESQRFKLLTTTLAARSEELKALVGAAIQPLSRNRKAS
jgi:energy-coupling factor transporter ATP-binding protein EcfA2